MCWTIVVVVAALAAAGTVFFLKDDRLRDDSDLVVERRVWPEHENGWLALEKLGSEIVLSEEDQDYLAGLYPDSADWDAGRIRAIVDANARAFETLDALQSMSVVADPRDPSVRGYPGLPPTEAGLTLNLYLQRGRLALADGRIDEAIRAVEEAVHFVRLCFIGSDSLIGYVWSSGQCGMLLSFGEPLFDDPRVATPELLGEIESLAEPLLIDGALVRVLKSEYTRGKVYLAQPQEFSSQLFDTPWELPLMVKPNRSANRLAGFTRRALAVVGAPRSEVDAALVDPDDPKEVERVLGANWTGDEYTDVTGAHRAVMRLACRLKTTLDLMLASLALQCYSRDHGGLPPTLDALVPDFLATVPVDWMDGQPLRYDRDRRVIWSVGKDLVDDGGDPDRSSDRCVRLDWH